ncbi:MAG: hypothetical protein QOK47_1570, partial [Actinomycetota bacterium]|nr:hypothetical protein [Actinomycetota bacterium]
MDRPLSVLHVTQPVDGGVATYVSRLATAQVERGLQVTVACPNGDLVGVLSASGIARVEWPAVRAPGPWLVRETRALQRLVEQVAPDLIHLHSAKAGAAGRMSKDHSRTIFQPHGWSWEAVGRAVGGVVTAWERRAGSRCALLICVSEEERARGLSAGVHANWCVIENAVDIEAFAVQTPEDRMTARASLGLPSAPIVVCLGTLRPAKGQDVLVGAWPLVMESVPEATLVIVGDGPERDKLKGLAGDGVEMVGHQDRV